MISKTKFVDFNDYDHCTKDNKNESYRPTVVTRLLASALCRFVLYEVFVVMIAKFGEKCFSFSFISSVGNNRFNKLVVIDDFV